MSQQDDTTPLSFATYLSATERSVLPLDRPMLLGTFFGNGEPKALVRMGSGAIHQMRNGDHIGQARIVEVGQAYLDVMLLGERHRLTLPDQA